MRIHSHTYSNLVQLKVGASIERSRAIKVPNANLPPEILIKRQELAKHMYQPLIIEKI